MTVDRRSRELDLPLADEANNLNEDMVRMRDCVEAVETHLVALKTAVATLSEKGHTHDIPDVSGLSSRLESIEGDIAGLVSPTLASLQDVQIASPQSGQVLLRVGATWTNGVISSANISYGSGSVSDSLDSVFGEIGNLGNVYASLSGARFTGLTRIEVNSDEQLRLGRGVERNPYLSFYQGTRRLGWIQGFGDRIRIAADSDPDKNLDIFHDGRLTWTGKTIWHSGNHGSGSGLNADMLDGLHVFSFVRSDVNDNVNAHTEWQDGYQARFGNDANLRISHNGTNSWIDNYTGNLFIRNLQNSNATGVQIQDKDANGAIHICATFEHDIVSLRHDGVERLRTTESGVQVYGQCFIGINGAGDSLCQFWDDNSNTWRGFGWDDSRNGFVFEDNAGGVHDLSYWKYADPVPTQSGNLVSFSGLQGAREIEIFFHDVSLTTNNDLLVRIGDNGGIEASGYKSGGYVSHTARRSGSGNAFLMRHASSSLVSRCVGVLRCGDDAGRSWFYHYNGGFSSSGMMHGSGGKTLSSELTQIEIRPASGNFDSGSIGLRWR